MKHAVIFDDWQNHADMCIELAKFAGEQSVVMRPVDTDDEFIPLVIVYDDDQVSDEFVLWLADEMHDGNARRLHFVTRG